MKLEGQQQENPHAHYEHDQRRKQDRVGAHNDVLQPADETRLRLGWIPAIFRVLLIALVGLLTALRSISGRRVRLLPGSLVTLLRILRVRLLACRLGGRLRSWREG